MKNVFDYGDAPMLLIEERLCALTGKTNIAIAKRDVCQLNSLFEEAVQHIRFFPRTHIEPNDLRLYEWCRRTANIFDFCTIRALPNTPTNKVPKFTERFSFTTREQGLNADDLFGDIYYCPDGTIGKARAIVWEKHVCFLLKMTVKNKILVLSQIIKIDNGVRVTLYKV